MNDTDEPIDEARTTRPRAGMVFRDRRQLPGLALLVAAVAVLAGFTTATAAGDVGWAVGLGVLLVITGLGGVAWILAGRNRTERGDTARSRPADQ